MRQEDFQYLEVDLTQDRHEALKTEHFALFRSTPEIVFSGSWGFPMSTPGLTLVSFRIST